ncbi:MAG: NAD(P)-dependent oxidoreductase [Candidatus Cloacimonetes bacterium]|nr:NAD(P)-dependent oxidoreductase [Candidatus Cloacimonadota bacterium]
MRQRVLLTGCHGRLGQHLLRLLLPRFDVLGVGRAPGSFVAHSHFRYAPIAGVGRAALKPLFHDFRPDAVLNAAAYTRVDQAEEDREACWQANVDLVRTLSELCHPRGLWLGQVSTDYVFDGEHGPYHESAAPAPLNVYGQSKLAAENLLRGAGGNTAIVRTIVVYGKGHGLGLDFVGWVLQELGAGRPIQVVTDQSGNCIWAMELARLLVQAMEQRRCGLFHAGCEEVLTRYELARTVARIFELDENLVIPVASAQLSQAARRPARSGLLTGETRRQLGIQLLGLEESLRAFKADRSQSWSMN